MVGVSCSVHQKCVVEEGLEGGPVAQCAEGGWRGQTFGEEDLSGPVEGMVVVVLGVA